MQLSRGHIDSLLGASFGPAYVTPVQFVSGTSQPWEGDPSVQVFASVTVSVVNDPVMEKATGSLVVTRTQDYSSPDMGDDEFWFDATGTSLPTSDYHLPPTTTGDNLPFASKYDNYNSYFIDGFSSAGILIDAGGSVFDGNNPSKPTYDPFFVISSKNLGDTSGAQFTFYRYGEFDGVFGNGGGGSPPPPPPNPAGQAAIWDMNGTTVAGGGAISPNPGPSWKAIGTGSFNDSLTDLVWQNASGQIAVWGMVGTGVTGGGLVSTNPGPSWQAIGTGNFYGDGIADDILWQNTATGQAAIWQMTGTNITGGGIIASVPGPSWHAIGTGDFNHDGHSDILWQDANGQVAIWEMNGTNQIAGGSQVLGPNPGPSWKAIGTGNFYGNGFSDILFQNTSSGQLAIWEMKGTNLIGGGIVGSNPGPSWHAIGTGDFDRSAMFLPGLSDILFQDASSGQVAIWHMDGTSIIGGGIVGSNPGPSWQAIGGNAAGDILFQNRVG